MPKYETEFNDVHIAAILSQARVSTRKAVTVVSSETYHLSQFVGQWSSGSRTLVSLVGCSADDNRDVTLSEHSAVVEHGTFCGKPTWCTVFVHPSRYDRIKPALLDFDLDEIQHGVLSAIATYNSKGRATWRDQNGVGKATWQSAIDRLIILGLVRNGGAITATGRNIARRADRSSTGKECD